MLSNKLLNCIIIIMRYHQITCHLQSTVIDSQMESIAVRFNFSLWTENIALSCDYLGLRSSIRFIRQSNIITKLI